MRETATMDAGRALDALVAERVMGYVWRAIRGERLLAATPLSAFWLSASDESDGTEPLRLDAYADVPFYSENIAAAWTVVEKLRGDGFDFSLEGSHIDAKFAGWLVNFTDFTGRQGDAGEWSVPLAICKAALAATARGEDGGGA